MICSAVDSAKPDLQKMEKLESDHAWCANVLKQAIEEATKASEAAQTARTMAEQAQKAAEEKLKDMERSLAEEKRNNNELRVSWKGRRRHLRTRSSEARRPSLPFRRI